MTPEQIKAAVEALTPLAERLGVTVEYIYAVYVGYQRTYAVVNLAAILICMPAVLVSWVLTAKVTICQFRRLEQDYERRKESGDRWPDNWSPAAIIIGIIAAIVIPFMIMWIGYVAEDSVLRLTNPDYYAIQAMLGLVKK